MSRPSWRASENIRQQIHRLDKDLNIFIERNYHPQPSTQLRTGQQLSRSGRSNSHVILELLFRIQRETVNYYLELVQQGYEAPIYILIDTLDTILQLHKTDSEPLLYWARKALEVDHYIKGNNHDDTKCIRQYHPLLRRTIEPWDYAVIWSMP